MATQVGEAVIKLSFDGKDVKASLNSVSSEVEKSGKQAGSRFGDALTVAAGNLISKGLTTVFNKVASNLDNAISRVDILNNFPKIMTNMGISADEAQVSINTLAEKLQGLPTSLQDGASAVERFTSKNGDVAKSTKLFLALNNAILAGGAPMEIQATALEQISQAYAKGKPDMMEWRAIQSAMPAQLNQISKSLLGNSDSLSRFMELAKEYQANNPMSSSASELIEQLEAVSNGTGDMTTAMGTALRLGIISMDEFMGTIESMNEKGVDGFQSLEEQAKNSTGGIGTALKNVENRIAAAIGKVIDYIGSEKIAAVINDISAHFKDFADVVIGVFDFVAQNWDIISPILAILTQIAGAIIAINVALKAYQKVMGAVNTITSLFGKTIGGISSGISKATQVFNKSPIGGAAEKIGNIFKKLGNVIKNALVTLKDTLVSVVQAIMEPLKELLTGLGKALAGFFSALADPAIAMGAAMFALAAASIAAAIFLVGSAIGAVMPALTELFNNIIMPIAQFIVDTVLVLIDALTNSIIALTNLALIPLGEFLVNSFVVIIQAVADVITNLTNNALVPLLNTLSGAFTNVINAVANLLTGVLNAALQGIADIIRAVGDGFQAMGNAVKTALEGVQGVLQTFADLIKSIAAAAVAMVAMVTGHSINYGSGYAHLFAQGGKVEGPGSSTSDSIPAMLSNGEYVIRASSAREIGYDTLDMLNEGKAWSGNLMADLGNHFTTESGSGRIINVYMTNEINNRLDAQEIGRVMMESIRRAA